MLESVKAAAAGKKNDEENMPGNFLEKCLPKDAIPPGLQKSQHEKRKQVLLKEEQRQRKKRKEVLEGRLEVAGTSLGKDNTGRTESEKKDFKEPAEKLFWPAGKKKKILGRLISKSFK